VLGDADERHIFLSFSGFDPTFSILVHHSDFHVNQDYSSGDRAGS
jgi:hypothetical protein